MWAGTEVSTSERNLQMRRAAVVFLLSGGIDSMVAADLIRAEKRLRLLPLFVDYGQPALSQEVKAAKSFCRLRRLPLSVMRLGEYSRQIGRASCRERV